MAKKKVEKPRREFTKRQLSRWQQQKRRQRIIFGAGILIVVVVLAIIGVGVYSGWYAPEYKPLHETVIEVNDTKFDMEYYIDMLDYYSQSQDIPIELMGYMADEVVKAIEQGELMKQEAMELGISISDDEVDEVLEGYESPVSEAYRDIVRTQMLVGKLHNEYIEQQVPKFAEQRHVMAMFLESEGQVNDVKARLETGEDFATLAGELSLDDTCKEKEGDLGWRPEGVLSLLIGSSILEGSAFSCEVGVLSEPIYDETKTKMVGYWLIEVLERAEGEEEAQQEGEAQEEEEAQQEEQTSVKVRVMLLASEQEANEVRVRLEEGEDFAALAGELSGHDASKQSGGEFEVTSAGMVSSAFDAFVFDPEVELGNLSQPIRDNEVSTAGGYWLIKVTEADENREIDEESRGLLKDDALLKWADSLWEDPENNIVSYLDEEKTQWAISYITGTGG